jgi:hypothetical protein
MFKPFVVCFVCDAGENAGKHLTALAVSENDGGTKNLVVHGVGTSTFFRSSVRECPEKTPGTYHLPE